MNFLQQTKLTREEWNNLEKPINNDKEKIILKMIDEGYNEHNIVVNTYKCLQHYLKIDKQHDITVFDLLLKELFEKSNKNNIFEIKVQDIINKLSTTKNKNKNMNKKDKIKLESSIKRFKNDKKQTEIIEFIIISIFKTLAKIIIKDNKKYSTHKNFGTSIYNLQKIHDFYHEDINNVIKSLMETIIQKFIHTVEYKKVLKYISNYVEHNEIMNYKKMNLYEHQKSIYNVFKNHNEPKFIWYCAPTSSGKTLTPIGLSNEYKVLFMCASKHIGLSLAKSSYFCHKKIAFALGCNDVEDIRLNYNAVNKYKILKNGRKIPDNTDGTKVEMIICDLLSFGVAMIYMKSFHPLNKIVLFWDEPTIGLDHETHTLHDIIKKNWSINVIPNVVFSCATLPKQNEIQSIVESFRTKFPNSFFDYIDVHDNFSNVLLYDEFSNVIMPHTYFNNLDLMKQFINYQGKKYFKFYNCCECAKFLLFYDKYYDQSFISKYFNTLDNIDMNYIKNVYIECLSNINEQESWNTMFQKYESNYLKYNMEHSNDNLYIGPELTTISSKSLTNGPTLYITNQIENISKYLLMKNQIDDTILKVILTKIEQNNKINENLVQKQKDYEDRIEKFKDNENVMANMRFPPDVLELHHEIERLQGKIKSLSLDLKYIPNTKHHYELWNKNSETSFVDSDVYSGCVHDETINTISQLGTLNHVYKILLLMGIGVFTNYKLKTEEGQYFDESLHDIENNDYVEIMKYLAENKNLYLILAHSDYIYGTNYQFSHCYLGKDMKNLSQEKIIQCIGRIGRQDKNKHFSFRFRCLEQIETLYSIPEFNIEAINMNKLFI